MKKIQLTCDETCTYDKDLHNYPYNKIKEFHSFETLPNLILYGPPGIGKYTQALQIVKRFSPSNLKYERKCAFEFNKDIYNFVVSDIHIEVDFYMLGCQSKLLWHEIYTKYVDILMSKNVKQGIIICKNFQNIHCELHDIFYSYMNNNDVGRNFNMKFIIISDCISFISNDILARASIISYPKPSKAKYKEVLSCSAKKEITNIKNIKHELADEIPYVKLCNELISYLLNFEDLEIITLREHIYNLMTYNLDIYNCIWYVNQQLSMNKTVSKKYNAKRGQIFIKTITFLHLYNNNYRPIYHLENYFIYLINIIHEAT